MMRCDESCWWGGDRRKGAGLRGTHEIWRRYRCSTRVSHGADWTKPVGGFVAGGEVVVLVRVVWCVVERSVMGPRIEEKDLGCQ
jgi:hypothetical protein